AQDQPGFLARVLLVGRVFTHRGELEYPVVAPHARVAAHDDMGFDAAAVADLDLRADDAPRPDVHVLADLRARIADRFAVHHYSFLSAHMIVAVQASSPSTEALHSNL